MSCTDKDKYNSKEGICCDRCPAGKHMKRECSKEKATTECAACGQGSHTATRNNLDQCRECKKCTLNNNKRILDPCSVTKDTVCECVTGFYCDNEECDHCVPVARCLAGEGVKHPATRTNNTVCAPCENGTFNNATDYMSDCKAHTRCEDYGRLLQTQGSRTADAVCGNFKSYCSWMLPAGLWSGLILTIFIVLAFILWRAKRKSYKTVKSSPATVQEIVPLPPLTPLNIVSQSWDHSTKDEWQICTFNTDENILTCATYDGLTSIPAVTTCDSVLRSHSEPQEDEWCGTNQ